MKRPLIAVALCYLGGMLLADFSQPPLTALFVFTFGLLVAAMALPRLRGPLLWPLIFFVGWTNLVSRTAIVSPHDLRVILGDNPACVTVRGTLDATPGLRVFENGEKESTRTSSQVRVTSLRREINWEPAFGTIVVASQGALPSDYFAGQSVEITGVLEPPPMPVAEGLFDYRSFLERQGIYYELKASSPTDWRLMPPGQNHTAAFRPVSGLGQNRPRARSARTR